MKYIIIQMAVSTHCMSIGIPDNILSLEETQKTSIATIAKMLTRWGLEIIRLSLSEIRFFCRFQPCYRKLLINIFFAIRIFLFFYAIEIFISNLKKELRLIDTNSLPQIKTSRKFL